LKLDDYDALINYFILQFVVHFMSVTILFSHGIEPHTMDAAVF